MHTSLSVRERALPRSAPPLFTCSRKGVMLGRTMYFAQVHGLASHIRVCCTFQYLYECL